MRLQLDRYLSPVSELLVVTDDDGALRALEFADHEPRMKRLLRAYCGTFEICEGKAPKAILRALKSYFAGDLNVLKDVPVAGGGTAFQRKVWRALRTIPSGTTMSYGQLANKVGCKGASRVVGAANGANPIAIVVPCHRVIGANGTLTGYGGGLPRKRWLIDHERRHSTPSA